MSEFDSLDSALVALAKRMEGIGCENVWHQQIGPLGNFLPREPKVSFTFQAPHDVALRIHNAILCLTHPDISAPHPANPGLNWGWSISGRFDECGNFFWELKVRAIGTTLNSDAPASMLHDCHLLSQRFL